MIILSLYIILFSAISINCENVELKTKSLKQDFDAKNDLKLEDFGNEMETNKESATVLNIGGTNLTTGTPYCIRDSDGNYLRWDGNFNSPLYGLTKDPNGNCLTNDLYQFEFELVGTTLRLKNVNNKQYLVYYSSYILLSSSTSTSYYYNINLIIRESGLISIQFKTYAYYIYLILST